MQTLGFINIGVLVEYMYIHSTQRKCKEFGNLRD